MPKISDEEFKIPNYMEYELVSKTNYTIKQLKNIARFHKQKVSGNKLVLKTRILNFLKNSYYANRLQKAWTNRMENKYDILHGPAIINRHMCNNITDFLSFDDIDKIPYSQFFSYKDNDGFIYGFDIKSFYNLLKNETEPRNPYNRELIPNEVKQTFMKLLRYGKILKKKLVIIINDDLAELSIQKKIELNAIRIFQKIDGFGHITDANWFLNLPKQGLIKLIGELIDIWDYRASLSQQTKIAICPPYGKPFNGINMISFIQYNIETLKINILNIFDTLISASPARENQSLGAFYILGALTLVSSQAASSMPWLYESMYHI